jgi:hypothetical protein
MGVIKGVGTLAHAVVHVENISKMGIFHMAMLSLLDCLYPALGNKGN